VLQALQLKNAKNTKAALNKMKTKKKLEDALDDLEKQKDNIQTVKMCE